MRPTRLFSALTAAVMAVSAIPLRVLAEEEFPLPIGTVALSGATTALIRGEVPKYTMQLSGASAEQAEIAEELWYDAFSHSAAFTRSGGEAVPLNDQSAYTYAVMIQAKEGSFFTDSFSVTYDGEPVDADSYSYEQYGESLILLYCGFLPLTESTDGAPVLYGDLTGDGDVNIGDAVLLMRLLNEDMQAPVSDSGLLAADLNRDGTLTLQDAKDLLLYLAGQPAAVEPSLSDEFGAVELPLPTEVCAPLQEGNSQAFEVQPLPGLTISAPENALSYDGQLQTAPLTEEKSQELTAQFDDYGIIMATGWEISAGLQPDEHLPGFYHSEYDLTALELPEELYSAVRVMRVDDNGEIHEYAAEVEGSTVKWDSDQNSFVILGIIAVGVAVAAQYSGMTIAAIYTVQIIAMLVAGAVTYWEFSRGEAAVREAEMYVNRMRFYETRHFKIWYALGQTADDGHRARVAAKENAARARAMEEVLEEVGDSGTANSPKFLIEAERRTRKYLAEDAEYQAMLTEVERVPADVRMLASRLETAYYYLSDMNMGTLVNQFNLSYKPDVLYTPSSSTLGLAVTPKAGADPYLLVERRRALVDDPLLIPESADILDYYGTSINAKEADDLLITATHEIFHIYQNKYFSGTDIRHLKFSEFSAMVLQSHAADYYAKNYYTTTEYSETVDKYFETYAVPFDEVLGEKEGQSHGYTLSHFYLYLEKKLGHHNALEFIGQYKKQNFNTALALSNLFGFGDDLEKLAKYWRSFLASYADIIGFNAYALKSYRSDSQFGYPGRQRRVTLSAGNQSVKVNMTASDLTATETVIIGPDGDRKSGTWQALIVKDGSIAENFKDFGFVFPRNVQKKSVAVRTRNGAAVAPMNDAYPIIERQGCGNTGSASYTVYLMMQPDAPELRYDGETNELVVNVRMPDSATARDRATDCMRLNVYVDGQLRALRNIRHEDLGEEIRISVFETFIPQNEPVTVTATVCECVTGDAESLTYFGPESLKATLTVDRTAETTTAPTETTATETTVVTEQTVEQTDTQTQEPSGDTTADVTDHTDIATETAATGTSEPHGDHTKWHSAETTTETTGTTMTETSVETTETEEPRIPLLYYRFDYVEGAGTSNTKSDTPNTSSKDADFGGFWWRADDGQEIVRMSSGPVFEVFKDGSFRLQIFSHSGKDVAHNIVEPYDAYGENTWYNNGFILYGNIRQSIEGLEKWEAEINDCSAAYFDFKETKLFYESGNSFEWHFRDTFRGGTLYYEEYEGYPELYAEVETADGHISIECTWCDTFG